MDETSRKLREPIVFEIFHHGQSVEAVVVGSRVTLSFTPYFAIPRMFRSVNCSIVPSLSASHMSITGCQVEPVASLYEWEREPLTIIKEGCQADNVGLVCPPQRSDFGIRVTVESFRYQSTAQVQYSCLVRVCPFAACPQVYPVDVNCPFAVQTNCDTVEGCLVESSDLLSRTFGASFRSRREVSLEAIRAALAANPELQHQIGLTDRTDRTSTASMRFLA